MTVEEAERIIGGLLTALELDQNGMIVDRIVVEDIEVSAAAETRIINRRDGRRMITRRVSIQMKTP